MGKWKAVVTGASGLLGRAVVREFQKAPDSWEVVGFAFSRTGKDFIKVDLRDTSDVESKLTELKPDVIVHCAAERRPNIAEHQEELTKKLNVDATAHLASVSRKLGSYLIYISTDYVFDGTKHPYLPGDDTNPLNKYGRSKRDGEVEVMKSIGNVAVLRVPILYGDVEYTTESAVTCLLDVLKKEEHASISDFEIRQPTHTDDVAKVCKQMCEKHLESNGTVNGIFHWGGKEFLTKYEMVKIMGEVFGLSTKHINGSKEPSAGAKRPYNCQLDCTDLIKLGISSYTDFREGIRKSVEKFL